MSKKSSYEFKLKIIQKGPEDLNQSQEYPPNMPKQNQDKISQIESIKNSKQVNQENELLKLEKEE